MHAATRLARVRNIRMSAPKRDAEPSLRVFALGTCLGLMLLGVVAQVQLALAQLALAPAAPFVADWLPPLSDWNLGVVPYALLLPMQILLLMGLTAVMAREARPVDASARCARWRHVARYTAVGYFTVMAARLAAQFASGAHDIIEAGGIPTLFHWVLALFMLLLGRRAGGRLQRRVWLNWPA